ncbi:Geraniol 8-hydroxylase [Vitis vinifera]|uniref:Geraniol 8-hydroxylase n=1 Tax=Vitis vinifera TaxID=29760 RepID=A0A438JJ82_VITVI|nr:Geraniol 8-hydroxylase [Vitis vinifera]
MEMLSCLLCFLVAWTSIYIMFSVRRGSQHTAYKLPPGPVPLPIIGNLLNLGNRPHESLAELAKTYGPIMTLKLGYVTTIVISSAPMAKEVLQKQDLSFCNRFVPDAIRATNHNQLSMAWMPVSTTWRVLRKICNSHLFTTQKLDSNTHLRHHKVQELLAKVEESRQAGDAVYIGREAFRTSLNLLSNTIFSVDLVDPISETVLEFQELVRCIIEEIERPNLVDYFPVLRKIDPQGSIATSDVLDTLLNISEDNSNEIERNHMEHLLLDLFVAGTDTTSSTLEWAMAELLHNPEKLLKARVELLQTIGKDKQVETPNIWENPNSFVPERFLELDMDVKGQNFELIPFGAGRRICPGLPLATRMVHLMLASLIHSCDWKLEDGITPENMNMEDRFGITLQKAQPLKAIPIRV